MKVIRMIITSTKISLSGYRRRGSLVSTSSLQSSPDDGRRANLEPGQA